jgi:CDP-glucose 4,6-dehydratase
MDKMVKTLRSFYQNKRVFITGNTGFKGSWLSYWLKLLGADVVGYALPPLEKSLFNSLSLDNLIHHINGDIRDYESFEKAFLDFQPEVVFHLAAQPLVRYSYQEPKLTFDTNIAGSVNLLELVRHSELVRSVIYVTSDKCYKNKEWIWGYRENDELGGHDPYSASKACAELVFQSYSQSYFLQRDNLGVASVRAGNVIGGGDWSADRIVPDCIKSLEKDLPIILRYPEAIRPWQHVLEPLSGYLSLAAHLYEDPIQYAGSWNFGPNETSLKTVHELTNEIITNWGSGSIQIQSTSQALHETKYLQLSHDKARYYLGWQPRWAFEETIRETTAWYKDSTNDINETRKLTQDQIEKYMRSGKEPL